jgi:hypothetical protein
MRDPDQTQKPAPARKPAPETAREERLKAALKANMARRKAQATLRAKAQTPGTVNNKNE